MSCYELGLHKRGQCMKCYEFAKLGLHKWMGKLMLMGKRWPHKWMGKRHCELGPHKFMGRLMERCMRCSHK